MDETVDALVVGAGPAGTTAANLLRQYAPSARIVLVERAPFPRHHVGESTLPDANRILARLGALDAIDAAGFVKKGGISFKWRSDRPTFAERFADAPVRVPGEVPRYSYQVERSRYDALLLEAARAQGVEVWQPARAEQVLRDGEQVVGMVVDGRRVGTRHVVDATGQARLLGRGLGLTAESLGLGDLAIYRYFRNQGWPREVGEPALSQIFFAACPAGWLWFIPLAEDRVSVGLVTRREAIAERALDAVFAEQIANVPEMATALERATPEGELRTVRNWSFELERRSGPGFYIAGDAAAFVDPILSSGVMLAHRAGLWAANAIHTEWTVSGVDRAALHAAYEEHYRDVVAGFVRMARWWYGQKKTDVREWWSLAAETLGSDQADLDAFMRFVAGRAHDFRFRRLGSGFGSRAFAVCMNGLEPSADTVAVTEPDRNRTVLGGFDEVSFRTYLGTSDDDDRFYELPMLRFRRGNDIFDYRPRVDRAWAEPSGRYRKRMGQLLDLIDGQRSLGELTRWACNQDRDRRSYLARVPSELVSLGLLELGPSVVAAPSVARHVPLFPIGGWTGRLAPSVFEGQRVLLQHGDVTYCPPSAGDELALESAELLALCRRLLGPRGSLEARVRAALTPDPPRPLRDLTNTIAQALCFHGFLRVAEPATAEPANAESR